MNLYILFVMYWLILKRLFHCVRNIIAHTYGYACMVRLQCDTLSTYLFCYRMQSHVFRNTYNTDWNVWANNMNNVVKNKDSPSVLFRVFCFKSHSIELKLNADANSESGGNKWPVNQNMRCTHTTEFNIECLVCLYYFAHTAGYYLVALFK